MRRRAGEEGRRFTVAEKNAAIDRYHGGEDMRAVAESLGIHKSELSRWQVQLDRRKIDNPDAVYVTRRKGTPPGRVPDREKFAALFADVARPLTSQECRDLAFERAAEATARGDVHAIAKWTRSTEYWTRVLRAEGPLTRREARREAREARACPRAEINRGEAWTPHAAQRPPEDGDWRTWLFMGGRGAGKTRAGAEWLAGLAEADGGARLALVGPTLHDVREVMVDGPSGLLNLPGRERPRWEKTRRRLVWANGATAQGFSAEDAESLRGPQFTAGWADELCVWPDPAGTLALLRMGVRLVGGARDQGSGDTEGNGAADAEPCSLTPAPSPRLCVTTTPKPIAALRGLMAEPGCAVTRAGTAANRANLAAAFLEGVEAIYGGTRLAAQEIEGVLVEASEGALWRAEELARCRGARPARLDRVVVAVDPPATAGGDACGIVAAGRLGERAFVLADRTAAGLSPLGWARRAVETAAEFGAEAIVAEANQGGDMVRATLAGAAPGCRVKLAHAVRSKRTRAEPVAALYEQGRVVHCGAFPALEEELMALGAESRGPSPDRADALVWALTELMLGGPAAAPRVRVL